MLGIAVGSQFHDVHGNLVSVINEDIDDYVLRNEQTNKKFIVPVTDFIKSVNKQEYIQKGVEVKHPDLTDYQKDEIDHRLIYVQAVLHVVQTQKLKPTTQAAYDGAISHVLEERPELINQKHPAKTTLNKYWKSWVAANYDDNALACARRGGIKRFNQATEQFLKHYVDTIWSGSAHRQHTSHFATYKRAALEEQQRNPEIHAVSARTFNRRINELKEQEQYLNIPGLSEQERNKRLLKLRHSIQTYFAEQRVEIDRMEVNMCLVDDDDMEVTEKLSIYLAVDVFTRFPLSVVYDFERGENKESVINLIRNMYLSDQNLPFKCKPLVVISDNGSGFNNDVVNSIYNRLGVTVQYAPSNQPQKKPFVESFIKVIRTSFFGGYEVHTEDGKITVGLNSYRGKRNDGKGLEVTSLKKRADLLKSDFRRLFSQFFTEYSHKVHNETKMSPYQAWIKSSNETPIEAVSYEDISTRRAFHALLFKDASKLQANGSIRCLKQTFSSTEAKTLFRDIQIKKLKGTTPEVKVYYDPFDARAVTISVTEPGQKEPTEVIAYNTKLWGVDEPISFNAMNGEKETSFSIYTDEIHKVTGEYAGHIKAFYPQKTRRKRNSDEISRFEANIKAGLSTAQRIEQAHERDHIGLTNKEETHIVHEEVNEPTLNKTALKVDNEDHGDDLW